jgi:hypothetical protein
MRAMKRSNNSSPKKHIPVNRIGKVTAKQLKTWVSEVSRDVSKRPKDEQFEECARKIRLLASRQNRKAAKSEAKVVSLNEPAFDTLCVQAPLFLNLRRAAIDFRSAMQALENGGGFIWPRDSGDISSVEISTELGKLQASIDAITAMLSVIGIPASRVDAKQDGRPKTNWAELGHAVGKEIRSLLLHVTGLKGLKLTYNHGIVPAISAHIVNHLFQIDIAGEGFAAQMRNRQRSKKIAPTKFGDRFPDAARIKIEE